MQIPQSFKKYVLDELSFVIAKMNQESDPMRKIYYYSGVRSIFERAARYHFDGELLIAHMVTDASYQMIVDRVKHIKAGDVTIPITENSLKELTEALSTLKKAIEDDMPVYPAAKCIIEIAYVATGPGFYTRAFIDYVNVQTQSQEGTSVSGMQTTR